MKSVIKYFIVCFCILLLSSCGDDENSSGVEQKVLDNFSISVPASWTLISKDSDEVPTPSMWKVVLVASSPEPQNGFANNIVILEKKVSESLNSQQYSLANKVGIEKYFSSYKELESQDLEFVDEGMSHVSVFAAKYNKNTPEARYIQTSRICNGYAYTMTITVGKEVQDFSRYITLLSTFECKSEK